MFEYPGPQQANVLDDQSAQCDSQSFGYEEVSKPFQELLFWQTLSERDRNKQALKVQICGQMLWSLTQNSNPLSQQMLLLQVLATHLPSQATSQHFLN